MWYVAEASGKAGPFSTEDIAKRIAQGLIVPITLIWTNGYADWKRAGDEPLFAQAFGMPPEPPIDLVPVPPEAPAEDDAERKALRAEIREAYNGTFGFRAIAAWCAGAGLAYYATDWPWWADLLTGEFAGAAMHGLVVHLNTKDAPLDVLRYKLGRAKRRTTVRRVVYGAAGVLFVGAVGLVFYLGTTLPPPWRRIPTI